MDLKNSFSNDSMTTIHEIGRDWGRLPHREPFYAKRLRGRRKERESSHKEHRGQENPTEEKQHEIHESAGHKEGFEIVV